MLAKGQPGRAAPKAIVIRFLCDKIEVSSQASGRKYRVLSCAIGMIQFGVSSFQ
jgi:hypothetical protein